MSHHASRQRHTRPHRCAGGSARLVQTHLYPVPSRQGPRTHLGEHWKPPPGCCLSSSHYGFSDFRARKDLIWNPAETVFITLCSYYRFRETDVQAKLVINTELKRCWY